MSADFPITLWTPYYQAATVERQAELDECLHRNIACALIEKVVLLVDDGHEPPFGSDKVEVVSLAQRPRYQDWIADVRRRTEPGLAILANSDIYFDDSVALLNEIFQRDNTFMALTRFDCVGESLIPHSNPHWSQDAWALRVPTDIDPALYNSLDVPLGVPRCDNKVAYVFAVHGWTLVNPFPQVRACHLHESGQRSYSKLSDATVMGAVAYVHPGTSVTEPAAIDLAIWTRGHQPIRKVSVNSGWLVGQPDSAPACGRTPGTSAASSRVDHNVDSGSASRGAPSEAQLSPATAVELRVISSDSATVFQFRRRFFVYKLAERFICLDRSNFRGAAVVSGRERALSRDGKLTSEFLAAFVPPVFDVSPIRVRDRPTSPGDVSFWQYPCATEKNALTNHIAIALGRNLDQARRQVHTYLGLPWATYTDKKRFPRDGLNRLGYRIKGLAALCAENGYLLRVHTVCQTIHWARSLQTFKKLGITDLHLSHCEVQSTDAAEEGDIRLHSWPLYAVNVETPDRSEGLVFGKPVQGRRYLASFIGAHMPHYRSEVRLQLAKLAQEDGASDLLVEVTDKWHFNDIVYKEQVKGDAVTVQDHISTAQSTKRYNEVLSESIFSLCPEGAGPNTLRIWESMAVGAIPVVIADRWRPPEIPGRGLNMGDCCIFLGQNELNGLFQRLRNVDEQTVVKLSDNCMKAYSRIAKKTAF